MGGQNSKLSPEAEAMPSKMRPLLQKSYEEIRSHAKAKRLSGPTLSTRQLLDKGQEEDHNSTTHHSQQSSSVEDSVASHIASHKVQPSTPERQPKVAPVMLEFDKETKQVKEHDEDQKCEEKLQADQEAKSVPVFIGGIFALEETADGEEGVEDNEEAMLRNNDIRMCPASPSFRIYCIESLEDDNDDSKVSSITNEDSIASVAANKNNGQDSKKKKKGRRRRKIRIAFSMGRPNAMKNLLDIKGCYYAACSSRRTRASILAEKSAAT